MSVTIDLDVWRWPYVKVKKAYVIRCRLLYCTFIVIMYDVCEWNSLHAITHMSFFVNFDLHPWPSAYIKVTFTIISRCTLYSCTLVPSIKFVGSIEFEIWTIVCRNLNDFTMTSSTIRILSNSNTNLQRAYLATNWISFWSDINGLKSKVGKLTENYEGKMDIVSLTLTFDPRSPIGFKRLQ